MLSSYLEFFSCDGQCQRSFHLGDENSERLKCRLVLGLTAERAKVSPGQVACFFKFAFASKMSKRLT